MDINATVQAVITAHPFYAFGAGLVLGPVWPRAINWVLTEGIDRGIPKVLSFQKFYLKKIGATDAQIKAIESREAQGLQRAAEDIKKDAEAA